MKNEEPEESLLPALALLSLFVRKQVCDNPLPETYPTKGTPVNGLAELRTFLVPRKPTRCEYGLQVFIWSSDREMGEAPDGWSGLVLRSRSANGHAGILSLSRQARNITRQGHRAGMNDQSRQRFKPRSDSDRVSTHLGGGHGIPAVCLDHVSNRRLGSERGP